VILLTLLLPTAAAAKPSIPIDVTLAPGALAPTGSRAVTVTVRARTKRTVRLEVVTSGAVDLASPAPKAIKLLADRPSQVVLEIKQGKDQEAHLLVRVHTDRGSRESAVDLAPEVTERKQKERPQPPVDRTADGTRVMR
jgi:hypothetical protein